jgi:lambda repressor-like predicted transcriptional regulator
MARYTPIVTARGVAVMTEMRKGGATQAEIARTVGISVRTVGRVLSGPAAQPQLAVRQCLGSSEACTKVFPSTGPWHRMCDHCRSAAQRMCF